MIRHLLILLGWVLPLSAQTDLTLSRAGVAAGSVKSENGIYQIEGGGPVLATPVKAPAAAETVLEMEYFCVGGVPAFAILPGPPFRGATARRVPALGHSETWSPWSARLDEGQPLPEGWQQLRLDLPMPAGRILQIRKVRLRAPRAGEFDPPRRQAAFAREAALETYLNTSFPARITAVQAGVGEILIQGQTGGADGEYHLADIPMDRVLGDPLCWEMTLPLQVAADGSFRLSVPRKRMRGEREHDRLLSRWQILRKTADGFVPVSHARYAEEVAPLREAPDELRPGNKKGLGGWRRGAVEGELEALGIQSITVNIVLQQLISPNPGPGTLPFQWQGRVWHARVAALENFDKTFQEAARHRVLVSAILLIGNPARTRDPVVQILGSPDAGKEGTFALPDVTTEEGASLYGGILNLMAERWSRADGKYGRVHHWIVHNEVDAAVVWTNAGKKTAMEFMDLYVRSMRMVDLIARQYDPHAKAFITLTHHWAEQGNAGWYGSRNLLDKLGRLTRAEGDFPWALAYHPYPQNLFQPRTWEDHQATYRYDSPKITPKNLEVLDAWMKEPERLYRGKVRPVHLSENGFNSKDYSAQALEDQAAGMAYAWKKIQGLSSIEAWQYHNWIDNRNEGGLRIGLRKFPDEPGDPYGKKPIWHLYQALGTPREDEVAAPYLKTIGIPNWDSVSRPNPVVK
ncbi:MAG: DUF5722 domain-containing protein [Akkermansiaceae bacterium]|jgi:hypothetical protein|nr:DUF5722 domain-containing protein [Akkermansiaceae bacterium]